MAAEVATPQPPVPLTIADFNAAMRAGAVGLPEDFRFSIRKRSSGKWELVYDEWLDAQLLADNPGILERTFQGLEDIRPALEDRGSNVVNERLGTTGLRSTIVGPYLPMLGSVVGELIAVGIGKEKVRAIRIVKLVADIANGFDPRPPP